MNLLVDRLWVEEELITLCIECYCSHLTVTVRVMVEYKLALCMLPCAIILIHLKVEVNLALMQ